MVDLYSINFTWVKIQDTSENFSKSKSVLQIESKFLDPDQELKRIFGSAAVNEAQSGNRNRNPHRNRPVRSGTIIRNAVPGRMPAGRGGLSMSEDEKRNNGDIMWWRFTHNKDYQETQEWFIFLSGIQIWNAIKLNFSKVRVSECYKSRIPRVADADISKSTFTLRFAIIIIWCMSYAGLDSKIDIGYYGYHKLGCAVREVVDSLLPHSEFGPNDHRKDASPSSTVNGTLYYW